MSTDSLDEAARLYARVRAGDLSLDEHRAIADWRGADPAHEAAWQRTRDAWAMMRSLAGTSDLAAIMPAAPAGPSRARRWGRLSALAAAALVAATVGTMRLVGDGSPPAARTWAYAEPRMLETAAGRIAQLALEDGSQVTLAPGSRLRIGPWSDRRRLTLDRGEAFFAVAHGRGAFVVEAGDAAVTAVGTAFSVARTGSTVRTVLAEGRVRVTPRSGTATTIDAGHEVRVAGGRITEAAQVDAGAETGWIKGELVFAQTPLREAVARYNRFAAHPVAVDPSVADLPVSGRFAIGGSGGLVAMLAAAKLVAVDPAADGSLRLTRPRRR